MKQIVTQAIVLKRTNFGEADRIITVLTPDRGKLRLIAKGVRKLRSRLAGGIELFSISDITYIPGRGDIHTLISSRLERHYGQIVTDINRTMLGYELLKRLDRTTEDAADSDYFELIKTAIVALDSQLPTNLLELWFDAQLIRLAGHQPNLKTDSTGQPLSATQNYQFDITSMAFEPITDSQVPNQALSAPHIKLLRLAFGLADPRQLTNLQAAAKILLTCSQLMLSLRRQSLGF